MRAGHHAASRRLARRTRSSRGSRQTVYRAPRNATHPHHAAPHRPQALRKPAAASTHRRAARAADRRGARRPGRASRVSHQRAAQVLRAKINADDLRARLPRRSSPSTSAHFKLRLFKHLKFAQELRRRRRPARLPDARRAASRSPTSRSTRPGRCPTAPWAGELAAPRSPGGSAANPLKARWMGIANGVGIHGTGEDYSIGSRASHGCIRMHVADVIDLYPRVPVGTPVLIQ